MTRMDYAVSLVCPHCSKEIPLFPATPSLIKILLRSLGELQASMQKQGGEQGGKQGGERERTEARSHA